MYRTAFYEQFYDEVKKLGGFFNAHLHLDRAGTLDDRYMQSANHRILQNSHISLLKKHSMIHDLHAGIGFQKDNLCERVNFYLDKMIACNTRRADTMVDVTADHVGLSALSWLKEIQENRRAEIDLRLAAYTPFGFSDTQPECWEVFTEGVKQADFIGCLPEADDTEDYPEHIGFMTHLERVLILAQQHNKMVHVHTDQRNEPTENGTEQLITAVERYGAPKSTDGYPMVWAVHMISPSTYPEERFEQLVQGLLDNNIGVICCPSAAIGMRQLRPIASPTYNSIPRVLELLAAGVHVRIASDNIADICSPTTTADLTDEILVLSSALRFYQVDILAKLAAGVTLTKNDQNMIQEHLDKNKQEIEKFMQKRY